MSFTSPGRLFLRAASDVRAIEDIYRYAEFLRRESGLTAVPPILLHRIYERFGIPTPERVRLGSQGGVVASSKRGIILINEDDPTLRQRFSEAHELVELLFAELPDHTWDDRGRGIFDYRKKERLCDAGAAELLMPRETFAPYVKTRGYSFETGRMLADLYEVSLTAALVRMTELAGGTRALVRFRLKNKPSEIKQAVPDGQMALLPSLVAGLPPKKLRVETCLGGPYIPPEKSVPNDSFIYAAWSTGEFTAGADHLELGRAFCGRVWSENYPFLAEGETLVLSLLSRSR